MCWRPSPGSRSRRHSSSAPVLARVGRTAHCSCSGTATSATGCAKISFCAISAGRRSRAALSSRCRRTSRSVRGQGESRPLAWRSPDRGGRRRVAVPTAWLGDLRGVQHQAPKRRDTKSHVVRRRVPGFNAAPSEPVHPAARPAELARHRWRPEQPAQPPSAAPGTTAERPPAPNTRQPPRC